MCRNVGATTGAEAETLSGDLGLYLTSSSVDMEL